LGEGPPNFWTCIIQSSQFPTMWPSFRAIGRGTSENAWRNKKKKKTSRAFYKSSRTTVTGGLKRCVVQLLSWRHTDKPRHSGFARYRMEQCKHFRIRPNVYRNTENKINIIRTGYAMFSRSADVETTFDFTHLFSDENV